MLKIEKFVTMSPEQWEIVIEGMCNPKNSWDKIDSYGIDDSFFVGENDQKLMESLAKGGPVHAKYRRMMPVWITMTAPLYWWKEFDTYKVGTVSNSCSTMHKIHDKEFTLDDFSIEHLMANHEYALKYSSNEPYIYDFKNDMEYTISSLNFARRQFLEAENLDEKKKFWWQMIQLLPSSYNQKRTIFLTYEVLHNINTSGRRTHKLDEWHTFCDFIDELPYSELITMELEDETECA